MNKSKEVEQSEYIKKNCPTNNQGISHRKPIFGVGLNDADYATNPVINGKQIQCPAYRAWRSMVSRGYSAVYHNKRPTYTDVKVCDGWLVFSNFREWWVEHHIDGYQLDKDLLVPNNTIYSPGTCAYVPRWLNLFIIDSGASRGQHKIGVHLCKRNNLYSAKCNGSKIKSRSWLGYFNTENEAHTAWLNRKLEIALELKPEMDEIDLRIYPNVIGIIKSTY